MDEIDRLRDEIEDLYFRLVAESSSARLRNLECNSQRTLLPVAPNSKEQPSRHSN